MLVTMACLSSSVGHRGPGFKSRALQLVDICGLISTHSDTNISRAGTEHVSSDRPLEPSLRASRSLVRASVGITDEVGSGTISNYNGLRETLRTGLACKIIGTRLFNLHSSSFVHYTAKVAVAAHHLHPNILPTLPSHSSRACTMGHHWIGLSTSHGKSRPWQTWWYGMVCYSENKWTYVQYGLLSATWSCSRGLRQLRSLTIINNGLIDT